MNSLVSPPRRPGEPPPPMDRSTRYAIVFAAVLIAIAAFWVIFGGGHPPIQP